MNPTIEISFKTAQAYNAMCKPLCQELKLPQTAFDILMFLANNPDCTTARDIVEIRKIKANLVSVNVDRLVQEGVSGAPRRGGRPPQDPAAVHRKGAAGHRAGARGAGALFCPPAGQHGRSHPGSVLPHHGGHREKSGRGLKGEWIKCTCCLRCLSPFFAGMGAGLGTGFAGMSAAAVISPMLITFLHMDPYMAVGIALSSDVLASAVSAYTYHKNKNLDIKNGLIMMASVLAFTVVGSWVASKVPSATMGGFSVFMTFLLGVKFILRPVMTTKEAMQGVSAQKRAVQSVVCGVLIGFICGFIGAGGGMMMLLILTSVLGYELKTAVGTSVFIMTFTALTGAVSHFMIGGTPDWLVWALCVVFTLLWARIAAVFANKATPKTLNRATGVVLVVLGVVIMGFNLLT